MQVSQDSTLTPSLTILTLNPSTRQTKANGVAWREHWNVWNVIGVSRFFVF